MPTEYQLIEAGGREVRISSPDKLIFAEAGITKRRLIDYYLRLAEPVLNQLRDRPTVLKRFPNGAGAEPFFQKRIPIRRRTGCRRRPSRSRAAGRRVS